MRSLICAALSPHHIIAIATQKKKKKKRCKAKSQSSVAIADHCFLIGSDKIAIIVAVASRQCDTAIICVKPRVPLSARRIYLSTRGGYRII